MRKIIFAVLAIALLFTTPACKKTRLTGPYAIYEGTWNSNTTRLELNQNGKGSYTYSDGTTTKNIAGRLIISGSELKIKFLVSKIYHIDTPPHEVSNYGSTYSEMTLDGEVFTKE